MLPCTMQVWVQIRIPCMQADAALHKCDKSYTKQVYENARAAWQSFRMSFAVQT